MNYGIGKNKGDQLFSISFYFGKKGIKFIIYPKVKYYYYRNINFLDKSWFVGFVR